MPRTEPSTGDMDPAEFRDHAHQVADWMADYLRDVETLPVQARTLPGELATRLDPTPSLEGRPIADLLREFREVILPGVTHWNHPSFHGYFAVTGSGPGILGEMISVALNLNAMTWQASPAGTEVEWVATRGLAGLLGLPESMHGAIHDTASTSSLVALAAARHRAFPEAAEDGLFGLPPGRIYTSAEAHSSIEKAARVLGFGRRGVRRIPVDGAFRMKPAALEQALQEDREAGVRPVAVVATLGTTSTTSVDPVAHLAPLAQAAGAWLHVDAAYGGPMAALPEHRPLFSGWEEADSIVVNPHKWLFTPVDCSVLFCREPDALRQALSLVPEYLRDPRRSADPGPGGAPDEAPSEATRDLMDSGIALGRRFRALKLRFVLEYFGVQGIRSRIGLHLELARQMVDWVEKTPGWEMMAPCPMATVVFRHRPDGGRGDAPDPSETRSEALDRLNLDLMERVNASGEALLSHTRLPGGIALRLSVGNLRTRRRHLEQARSVLEREARRLA